MLLSCVRMSLSHKASIVLDVPSVFSSFHLSTLCYFQNKGTSLWNRHPTHPFNGPLSGTTQVSRYQKGKTNLDFAEARDSEWQWHQLGHMQVCTWLQTDSHTSTPPLSFLRAGCPSCCPTNSIKALKELALTSQTADIEKFGLIDGRAG